MTGSVYLVGDLLSHARELGLSACVEMPGERSAQGGSAAGEGAA